MFQPEGFLALAKAIKAETKKTIWCYSGFVFENLCLNERQKALLQYIDVLVDGPYIEAQRDTDLIFRGSRNQRLIDVKRSLEEGLPCYLIIVRWNLAFDALRCKCQVVLLFLSFFIVMYRALFLIPCSLHREMRYFRR